MENSSKTYPVQDDLGPMRIFDNRKAKNLYEDYLHYRSGNFNIPPGYAGLLELITPEQYLPDMTFTIVRIPTVVTKDDADCFPICNVGKHLRDYKCARNLGTQTPANGQQTVFTSFNASVVFLGYNQFTQHIEEFVYIYRPGTYYVEANRCVNDVLGDCDNPTIIELSLLPMTTINPETELPCDPAYAQYF